MCGTILTRRQTSKVLNYLDSPITPPYFALFIGVWTYLRHYMNIRVLWAVLTEFRTVGPYELDWETQQYKCWISQIITFALLAMLQAMNLFWLLLILRIGYRFVTAKVELADERSEDEEEEEESEKREQVLESRDRETPAVLVNGAPIEDEAVLVEEEPKREMATRRSPRRKG